MSKFNTPILLILFNRPQYIDKQFEILSLLAPQQLYVALDGPRENNYKDELLCTEVKQKVLQKVFWDCNLNIKESRVNLGCKNGPISALNWFFNLVDEGIILEDDCLPSISFFNFASSMLFKYRYNEKIFAISGCNYGLHEYSTSYSYSRYMNPWGWATWRTSINQITYNLNDWKDSDKLNLLRKKIGNGIFDVDHKWFKFWINIFDQLSNKTFNSAWDYHWIYHIFMNNKYIVIPSKNLVSNNGFGVDATHTTLITHPANNLPLFDLHPPYIGPKKIKNNRNYEKYYVKRVCYMHTELNLIYYLKRFLTNNFPGNIFYRLYKKSI